MDSTQRVLIWPRSLTSNGTWVASPARRIHSELLNNCVDNREHR